MKIYAGIPDEPNIIAVRSEGETTFIRGKFSWGTKTRETAALSLAILTDLIGDEEARRLAPRFNWRETVGWAPGQPWMIDEIKIRAVLKSILDIEVETAASRRITDVAPRMPPDSAPIMAAAPRDSFGWTQNPTLVPNVKPTE